MVRERDEVTMNNRMESSWFIVLIKVEQLNDNLFLNTCVECSKIKQNIALMNDVKMSWYEIKLRWEGQARSIREISVREKPRWVQIKVERKCERGEILIFLERLQLKNQRQESEVGEEEVEWWAEWRRCKGRLFHKTGAESEWKNDLLICWTWSQQCRLKKHINWYLHERFSLTVLKTHPSSLLWVNAWCSSV